MALLPFSILLFALSTIETPKRNNSITTSVSEDSFLSIDRNQDNESDIKVSFDFKEIHNHVQSSLKCHIWIIAFMSLLHCVNAWTPPKWMILIFALSVLKVYLHINIAITFLFKSLLSVMTVCKEWNFVNLHKQVFSALG